MLLGRPDMSALLKHHGAHPLSQQKLAILAISLVGTIFIRQTQGRAACPSWRSCLMRSHIFIKASLSQTGIPGSAQSSQWVSLPGNGAGFPSGRSWPEECVTQGANVGVVKPLVDSPLGRKRPPPARRISEMGHTQKPDES